MTNYGIGNGPAENIRVKNHPMTTLAFGDMYFKSFVVFAEPLDNLLKLERFKPRQDKNPTCLVAGVN